MFSLLVEDGQHLSMFKTMKRKKGAGELEKEKVIEREKLEEKEHRVQV